VDVPVLQSFPYKALGLLSGKCVKNIQAYSINYAMVMLQFGRGHISWTLLSADRV